VSPLSFLSVDAAADQGGIRPVAKSAIDRAQRDLGATFEERGGWLVPVSIPGEDDHGAVGIADVSHLTKLEVRPAGEEIVVGEGDPGVRLKPDLGTLVWYRISPRRALVLCAPALGEPVRAQVGARFSLDVTGAYSVIAIAGPEAATVLRRMTHIHHFPSGGEIAHVQGHVLQRDGGYWVICAQELGHYVWEVAVDRASPLGGGPVGVDALTGGAA
jgi:glycine cleavage system aminomethyltransferase T